MADLVPVEGVPPLHTVPSPELTMRRSSVVVQVDDVEERRITLTFSPLQALRVLTADVYVSPPGAEPQPRRVVEVTGSDWVRELADTLARLSPYATFMQQAHHWLVPAGDEVIEVVAWRLEVAGA